ncbi:hypothetical protein ABZ454_16755 [Streptomyces sp. NPDC005803]
MERTGKGGQAMTAHALRRALDARLSPRTPAGRVLVTGWFSFATVR